MRTVLVGVASILYACGGGSSHANEPVVDARKLELERRAIATVLDAWHDAAASAREEDYFGHFAEDAIFLGTDATERWTVAQFREYAHPFFERGRAWSFRAARREIYLNAAADFAWFDEDLETERLGPARGSGVLRRVGPLDWKIVQYNLAITIPNDRFADVRALLDAVATPPPPPE